MLKRALRNRILLIISFLLINSFDAFTQLLSSIDQPLKWELIEANHVKSLRIKIVQKNNDQPVYRYYSFDKNGNRIFEKPCWTYRECEYTYNSKHQVEQQLFYNEINDSMLLLHTYVYEYDKLGNRSSMTMVYPDGGKKVMYKNEKVRKKKDTAYSYQYENGSNGSKFPESATRSYFNKKENIFYYDHIDYDRFGKVRKVKYYYQKLNEQNQKIESGERRYSDANWEKYFEEHREMALKLYANEALQYTFNIPNVKRPYFPDDKIIYDEKERPIEVLNYSNSGNYVLNVEQFTYNESGNLLIYKSMNGDKSKVKTEVRYTYSTSGLLQKKESFDDGAELAFSTEIYEYEMYE